MDRLPGLSAGRLPGAAPEGVPVIDCHAHLHDDPGGARGNRLLAAADQLGIQRLMVSRLWGANRVPATATPDDFRRANQAVEAWVALAPDRLLGYCFVSCTYPEEAERELEECIEHRGFRGLKLYAACRFDDPRVLPVVQRAASYGVPTLLHVVQRRVAEIPGQYVSDGREVASLARQVPEAALILAHVGGGGDWAFSVKAIRDCPGVYVDLSGSVVDAGLVEHAYACVGPDRLLFGTDSSMCEGVGKLQGAAIPDARKAAIWGANFERLLAVRASPASPARPARPAPTAASEGEAAGPGRIL